MSLQNPPPPHPQEIPIPSVGGVWIFSGTAQYNIVSMEHEILSTNSIIDESLLGRRIHILNQVFIIFAQFQAIQAAKGANASLSGFHIEHRDELVVQFESS